MTLNETLYFAVPEAIATEAAMVVLFVWLYRSTRLKPVLYYLCWYIFSLAWGWVIPSLNRSAALRAGHTPQVDLSVFVASQAVSVLGTLLFFWAMISLVRRGRPSVKGETAPSERVSTRVPGKTMVQE